MTGSRTQRIGLLFGMLSAFGIAAGAKAQPPTPTVCNGGDLPAQAIMEPAPAEQPDLLVSGVCNVQPGKKYYYANVNVINQGQLDFKETASSQTAFWASSIIIENGGTMRAGTPAIPFGAGGGTLTIYLYGSASPSAIDSDGKPVPADMQGQGALCRSPISGGTTAPCGIPQKVWDNNGVSEIAGCVGGAEEPCLPGLPSTVKDYFYRYGPLYGDGKAVASGLDKGKVGYFGYKTLAVSFGGTLDLHGYKGASYDAATDADHTSSGVSWVRLAQSAAPGDTSLTLATDPGDKWKAGDEIVVTTTDYLPGHSERLKIASTYAGGTTIPLAAKVLYPHNGKRFALEARIAAANGRMTLDPQLLKNGAETRAAVALLTRSIRIVSAGDAPDQKFGDMPGTYYFGAHSLVRQGFAKYQVQGVEFAQMGQGGRLGHYPVHFHMVRQTPPDTYVKDSSVNESMTRWYVIHSTSGVTLARDVGYLSIGHGYYLEDATETNNNFYSDIGIFARAAVDNIQNPRKVPGILSDNNCNLPPKTTSPDAAGCSGKNASSGTVFSDRDFFPYYSDSNHPSVFWITNGWNNFVGNMAAGAGTCGACYWLVPAWNSGMADVGMQPMKWTGYASMQAGQARAGTTPLESFYGNYCSSAESSFMTIGNTAPCPGVVPANDNGAGLPVHGPFLKSVPGIAPAPAANPVNEAYYPRVSPSQGRLAALCPNAPSGDCSATKLCTNSDEQNCAVTVLDHYTSSFHWADTNQAAIWLRPFWYLVDNSVLSDVQNGGLTFVTGGDYTRSSIPPGYWSLARDSVFIGNDQDPAVNPFASNAGPFNGKSGLTCDAAAPPYCMNRDQGITIALANFAVNQRLFNIYDGPSYQDTNAYLDITTTPCGPGVADCMYGASPGVRKNPVDSSCYLPNAAIAWKQPNGFFYPPAFHSTNLYFDKVEIRHFVIEPLFKPGTYDTDDTAVTNDYCVPFSFNGFTDIDRQTELNDDDGSLTGLSNNLDLSKKPAPNPTLKQTISVNQDPYFHAPVETAECLSNIGVDPAKACPTPPTAKIVPTAGTSPYDYVTTAVVADCSQTALSSDPNCGLNAGWWKECDNPECAGVPLYRQLLTGSTAPTREWKEWLAANCTTNPIPDTPACNWPFIRMAGAAIYQRSTMTVDNGTYYLDTAVSVAKQKGPFKSEFEPGSKYYVFFVYAKPTTKQTYHIYVGKDFKAADFTGAIADIGILKPSQAPTFKSVATTSLPAGTLKADTSAVAGAGILNVTVDFANVTDVVPSVAQGLCQPASFCTSKGTACVSTTTDASKKSEYDAICGHWAMKDLDCPADVHDATGATVIGHGCIGFSFTLPATFKADDQNHRPQPMTYPATADITHLPDWTTLFDKTKTDPDKAVGGACFYPELPGSPSCPINND